MEPMRDEQPKAYRKVSCLCGADVRVDPLSTDRRVTCRSCGSTFDFVVTVDPTQKKARLSLVLPRAAMKTEGESLGKATSDAEVPPLPLAAAPPPPPQPAPKPAAKAVTRIGKKPSGRTIKASMCACECGTSFPLEDTGELATRQSCPQCNRIYHVIFKIEPGSKQKSAIAVPDKPIVHRGEKIRTLITKAPPVPAPDPFLGERKGRTRVASPKVSRTSRPKPPPEIPPGAQGVPCPCGEIFVVRRKDLDREMTCAGCGKTVSFFEGRDPQSLAPTIQIRTRPRP